MIGCAASGGRAEGRARRGKPLLDDQLVTLGLASGLDLRIVFEVKAGKSSEDGALDLLVATRSGAAAGALSLSVPEPGAAALLAVGLLACALARPRRTGARDRGLA